MKLFTTLLLAASTASSFAIAEENDPFKVVVYGQVIDGQTNDSTTPVNTINQAQIQASGASSIVEVLQRSGLVHIGSSYTGNGRDNVVSIGGYGENAAQNTLILLDGQPLNYGTLETVNLGNIPLATIEKIELITAGAGVLFGEGATGGAINLISKRNEISSGTAEVKFGSNRLKSANIFTTQALNERTYVDVSMERETSEGHRENNDSSIKNLSTAIRGTKDKLSWEYKFRTDDSYTELPGPIGETSIDYANKNYQLHNANAKYSISKDTTLSFNIAKSRSQNTTQYSTGPHSTLSSKRSVSAVLDHSFDSKKVKFGLDQSEDRYGYSSPERQKIESFFGNYQSDADKDFSYSAGVRRLFVTDHISLGKKKNDATNYNTAISYKLTNASVGFIRFDRSTRIATLDEEGSGSNPSYLKPQQNDSKMIGLKGTNGTFDWKVSFNKVDIKDEIYYDDDLSCGYFGCNINLPKSERRIINFDMSYKLSDKTRFGSNITNTEAKFKSGSYNGKDIPWVPETTASIYVHSRFADKTSIYLNTSYVGKKYLSNDYDNSEAKVKSYLLTDASINYELDSFTLGFDVKNLFDKQYNAFAKTTAEYPAAGRTVAVKLKYDF
jgi:iron complex outermembrane receptor protein